MRLLEKNNRTFFRFTAMILAAGSILFFMAVDRIIRSEIDEKLEVNRLRTIELLRNSGSIPRFAPIVEVEMLDQAPSTGAVYADTMIYDPVEKEDEPYRQLVDFPAIGGHYYRIVNRTSLVETDELMVAIALCTSALALLLFGGLYWLNRRSSIALWRPFQDQLHALRSFALTQPGALQLPESDIAEFEELRNALLLLTDKVRADYQHLKEFTENASHEIQTPLAVIRSRIESLIGNEGLNDEQLETLSVVYDAVNRLSRLNQSLLLLTKIENRQFPTGGTVCFNDILAEQVAFLQELTEANDLVVKTDLRHTIEVAANPALAEILVKNLLENALRYSPPGSTIEIATAARKIAFINPGEKAVENPDRLFERFRKSGRHSGSLGLGLAIVKKICEVSGWQTGYTFRDGRHEFSVAF